MTISFKEQVGGGGVGNSAAARSFSMSSPPVSTQQSVKREDSGSD